MDNIFKSFVLARPVKTPLDFGHNENIVIESIDFGIRKKKGIPIKANTFIKLTKINIEDKSIIANTEISFWNLDPSKDFIYDNFISQFSILSGILNALGKDTEKYEDSVLNVIEGDSDREMLLFLKKPVNAKLVQDILVSAFKEQVIDSIGLNSDLLKCKMVSNKSGYLQPANDIMWILSMKDDTELPIVTSKEQRIYKKALTAKSVSKPDTVGESPAKQEITETVVSSNSLDSI